MDDPTALMFLRFSAFFGQTCLEAVVTPLMERYFGSDDYENSLLFLFAGLELVLVSAFVAFVSMRVSDRSLILVGITFNVMFYIFNIAVVPLYQQGNILR